MADTLSLAARALFGLIAGFGYQTERLFLLLLTIFFGFWALYATTLADCEARRCSQPALVISAVASQDSVVLPPVFDPALYSLDALLPSDLGYISVWKTTDTPAGRRMRWAAVTETILGWILAGVVVGVVSKNVSRN